MNSDLLPRNLSRRDLLRAASLLGLGITGCVTRPRRIEALPQAVAPFSTAPELHSLPPGWDNLVMRRDLARTHYEITELRGRRVLHAWGLRGASGARCKVHVDPLAQPWIEWSWRTRDVPDGLSVGVPDTDDSPARLAIAFQGDERRLSLRDRALYEFVELITGERLPYATLMYVWDGKLPVEAVADYARTSRIRYLVVESGSARAGRWLRYRRNLVTDFRRVFDEEPGPVLSVGVVTDGDDLRLDLESWYGDIQLVGDRAGLPVVSVGRRQ